MLDEDVDAPDVHLVAFEDTVLVVGTTSGSARQTTAGRCAPSFLVPSNMTISAASNSSASLFPAREGGREDSCVGGVDGADSCLASMVLRMVLNEEIPCVGGVEGADNGAFAPTELLSTHSEIREEGEDSFSQHSETMTGPNSRGGLLFPATLRL